MQLTHTQKLKLQSNNAIVLLKGQRANGQSFFAYVELTREGFESLQRDSAEGKQVDFSKYGNIILNGDGEPTEENKQFMIDEYNFDHNA